MVRRHQGPNLQVCSYLSNVSGLRQNTGRELFWRGMPGKSVDDYTWDEILPHLQGVEGGNGQWQAWCPCHDDFGTTRKGLSLTERDGRKFAKCFSCEATLPEIIDAIEGGRSSNGEVQIKVTHVHTEMQAVGKGGMAWWVNKTGVPADVWKKLGCIAQGNGVVFTFRGHDAKKVRTPTSMAWQGTNEAKAPALWPAIEDTMPEKIEITEGESDCGTLCAAGMAAYALTKGAKGALPNGAYESLAQRGVKEITFHPDNDDAGEAFAQREATRAIDAGLIVNVTRLGRILDAFSGLKDLNDVYRECSSLKEFKGLLNKAVERLEEENPAMTYYGLDEKADDLPDPIIPDLFFPGDKALLAGPPKAYKTWVALDLMRSFISGTPFLARQEWTPKKKSNVLFIQEEGSIYKWAQRVSRLQVAEGDKRHGFFWHRQGFNFIDPTWTNRLIALARRRKIEVIFFDPLQRMIPGVNENDAAEVGVVWNEIQRIQLAIPEIICVVLHHTNKADTLTWGSIRGSSRHAGEVDLGLLIEKRDEGECRIHVDGRDVQGSAGVLDAKVEITDTSLTINAAEEYVKVNVVQTAMEQAGANTKMHVIDALHAGCKTRQAIISHTNLSEPTVRRQITKLVEAGRVEEIDHGNKKAKEYRLNELDEGN